MRRQGHGEGVAQSSRALEWVAECGSCTRGWRQGYHQRQGGAEVGGWDGRR
jgi:hypothetical protein